MKNIKLMSKKLTVLYIVVSVVFSQSPNSKSLDLEEYTDMFLESFEYLNEYYVDSIDQTEIIRSAIKGMTNPLDPYTR